MVGLDIECSDCWIALPAIDREKPAGCFVDDRQLLHDRDRGAGWDGLGMCLIQLQLGRKGVFRVLGGGRLGKKPWRDLGSDLGLDGLRRTGCGRAIGRHDCSAW